MCTVSMIGDHYGKKIDQQYPDWQKWSQAQPTQPWFPVQLPTDQHTVVGPLVSRKEFLELKKTVDDMVELLRTRRRGSRCGDAEGGESVSAVFGILIPGLFAIELLGVVLLNFHLRLVNLEKK